MIMKLQQNERILCDVFCGGSAEFLTEEMQE